MHHILCSFFVKHQIIQVTQPPYSPDLVPCDFWLFPKLKSPLKGKSFQSINETQENMTGQLMETGRTVWGPKVPTLKGTEASLSYVSIFHITWLDTFWMELVCLLIAGRNYWRFDHHPFTLVRLQVSRVLKMGIVAIDSQRVPGSLPHWPRWRRWSCFHWAHQKLGIWMDRAWVHQN